MGKQKLGSWFEVNAKFPSTTPVALSQSVLLELMLLSAFMIQHKVAYNFDESEKGMTIY